MSHQKKITSSFFPFRLMKMVTAISLRECSLKTDQFLRLKMCIFAVANLEYLYKIKNWEQPVPLKGLILYTFYLAKKLIFY